MSLSTLPVERIALSEMPICHRIGARNGHTYIRCGAVKRGGNEPYCYTEEKQCSGHICRVLSPETVIDQCLVVRDDKTLWKIHLSNFLEVSLLEIEQEAR